MTVTSTPRFFGWANLLNMDPETASGSCLAPMRMLGLTSKMYITVLTPGGAFVTAVVGYFALKSQTHLNLRMRLHHLERAMVQVSPCWPPYSLHRAY